MNTYFFIARHFWKDGENASWQVARNFPSELLKEFKRDYTLLENTQPEFRHYDEGTVFFVYKQAEDTYGRRITEITAATCGKRLRHPESITNLFQKKLQSFDNVNLCIAINDSNIKYENNFQLNVNSGTKKNSVSTYSNTSKKKLLSSTILIGCIIILCMTFIFSEKNRPSENKPLKSDVVCKEKPSGPIIENNQDIPKLKKNTGSSKATPKNTREQFKDNYAKLKCNSKEWPVPILNSHCAKYFIKNQLEKGQTRLSYDKWVKNIGKNKFEDCRKKSNVSKDDIVNWLVVDGGMDRTIVKEFFSGKK